MNTVRELSLVRGFSASDEARQLMADWLRTTKAPRHQSSHYRELLMQRYPAGLFNEAELDALMGLLDS